MVVGSLTDMASAPEADFSSSFLFNQTEQKDCEEIKTEQEVQTGSGRLSAMIQELGQGGSQRSLTLLWC